MGIRGRYRLASFFLALLSMVLGASPVLGVTGWTGPERVGGLSGCSQLAAAIDEAGTLHIAADCDGQEIRYATNAGDRWTFRAFTRPRDSWEGSPQVAIDGDRVYVAWTRELPATCGHDYVGVFYRSRSLLGDKWAPEIRLGADHDRLQSFRVVGRVIHATVGTNDGVVYERLSRGVLRRYSLPGAVGTSSLRISNAGTARIAYQAANGLRYARFDGSVIRSAKISGTSAGDRDPVLVLDAKDRPHVVWTRTVGPQCGDESPMAPGTYYATNQDGKWTANDERRVTGEMGGTSLTVNTATGRVHLVVGGKTGVRYFTKARLGAWKGTRLSSEWTWKAVVRLDQESGQVVVVSSVGGDGVVWFLTEP